MPMPGWKEAEMRKCRAQRVSTYMSYQILHEMRGWEEDMDKMLMMLPIVGTMFKKTWYDKRNGI
jgi:chaperonin GroES